jgi:hypothetical protein
MLIAATRMHHKLEVKRKMVGEETTLGRERRDYLYIHIYTLLRM